MKLELAKFLEEHTEGFEEEIKVIEGYSGRGMCGAETTAVSVSSLMVLVRIIYSLSKEISEQVENGVLDIDIGSLRSDNLGHDIVVY